MENENFEEVDVLDDNPENQAIEEEEVGFEEEETPSYEVPEKFRGKSFEDVVEAYTNLEKEHGRKANEVGELRKLTDEILKKQLEEAQTPKETVQEDLGFDDLVDNPAEAIDKALNKNPRLKAMEETLNRERAEKAAQVVKAAHEDAEELVRSTEFNSWLRESPVRANILLQARDSFDAAAMNDLLTLYKTTRQSAVEDAKTARDTKAKADLKRAAVEKGSPRSAKKKVYKRSELIQLRINNPNKYDAMAEEIRQAYAEGRVR